MECPSCGSANRTEARFCDACGTKLGEPERGAPRRSGCPECSGARGSSIRPVPRIWVASMVILVACLFASIVIATIKLT